MLALVAAAVSIVVKEWMYWYTRAAAKKIHSDALMADAWHHRSDSLSSIGALVGIVCSLAGFPVMDSVASVVICIFIVKAAVDIFRDAVDKMVDRSCDEETLAQMTQVILDQPGVLGLDLLQTRLSGRKSTWTRRSRPRLISLCPRPTPLRSRSTRPLSRPFPW